MESSPLVLTDPNMLAEFVRQSHLKAFFEKRLAVPEDIGAILFRDGAIVDGYNGTQFSIGGLWENLKGIIGGSHHYEVMLADLKPFDAVIPVRTISKDHIEIVGEASFQLQLNPEKITNVLGLMRGVSRNESDANSKTGDGGALGRKCLLVGDVIDRLEPHFRERIFGAVIGRHNAEELRGSRGMQDQIQADMMKEAERILGDLGVLVRASTINFATNEQERQDYERARIARDEKMKDFALDVLKQQVSREADSTSFMLETKYDVAKLQRTNDDEMRQMLLDSEVAFVDAREMHKRRQEFEALNHEARMLLEENEAKTQVALSEIEDNIAKTKAQHSLVKVQNDLTSFQNAFTRQEKTLEADFQRSEDTLLRGHIRGEGIEDSKTGLTRTKIDTESKGVEHDEAYRQARQWADLANTNRRASNEAEVDHAKGMAQVDVMKLEADSKSQVDKMLAAGSLSPDQLSHVMPGLSESAAQVAIARAQAEGMNADKMMALVREMTAESRDHEHRMFGTGMQGGVGMAAGLGSGDRSSGGGLSGSVECPNCKTENPAKAKFCKTCQTQLRN